jgi:type I restriction enzyme S subunit
MGTPIVRVNNLRGGRVVDDEVLRVSSTVEEKYSRTRLRGGEVLLSLVGTLGECAVVPETLAGWNVARAVAVIPVVPEIGPQWVAICLRSQQAQHFMKIWATTTVQATLNLRDVARLPIPLPPEPERSTITKVLDALDDKIDLNRRMNETLEEVAQATFKSWFVNFDPVRAKMEGSQPSGMDGETATLFPDTFEGSPLGEIPKGWSVETIYSVADVIYGAPFSSKLFNEEAVGLPLLRIRDLATHDPKVYTPEEHPKGTKVVAGDIVVGMDGEFRAHIWTGPDAWLNQRVCMFVPKKSVPIYFVKESLREPLAFFERAKVGTTVIHLGKGDIDTFLVIVPDQSVMEAFGELIQPIVERTISNVQENHTLGAIRDALLPKLLSGEIRVRGAQEMVEETA